MSFFVVLNGAIKTRKSVLFPSGVESLCNNTEVVKLVQKYSHGIFYNLIDEIETEYALSVIDEQAENRAVIPELFNTDEESSLRLMVVDNTLSGAGKSVYAQTRVIWSQNRLLLKLKHVVELIIRPYSI